MQCCWLQHSSAEKRGKEVEGNSSSHPNSKPVLQLQCQCCHLQLILMLGTSSPLSGSLERCKSSSSRRSHKSQGLLQNATTVLLLVFLSYTDSAFISFLVCEWVDNPHNLYIYRLDAIKTTKGLTEDLREE